MSKKRETKKKNKKNKENKEKKKKKANGGKKGAWRVLNLNSRHVKVSVENKNMQMRFGRILD